MRILFGGPDGCGKSTVTELVAKILRDRGLEVQCMHYRPNLVMPGSLSSSDVMVPQGRDHHGMARSIAKLLVTFADFGMFELRRKVRREPSLIVLQERGWWDQAVDTERYRLHPRSRVLVRLMGMCMPRADLTVVLSGSPDLIHARKPELAIPEIERQLMEWAIQAKWTGRRRITIDVMQAPDSAAQAVIHSLEEAR